MPIITQVALSLALTGSAIAAALAGPAQGPGDRQSDVSKPHESATDAAPAPESKPSTELVSGVEIEAFAVFCAHGRARALIEARHKTVEAKTKGDEFRLPRGCRMTQARFIPMSMVPGLHGRRWAVKLDGQGKPVNGDQECVAFDGAKYPCVLEIEETAFLDASWVVNGRLIPVHIEVPKGLTVTEKKEPAKPRAPKPRAKPRAASQE